MCNSLRILGEAPSGPADLFGFILDNFLATSSIVRSVSSRITSVLVSGVFGMLTVSSLVTTEEKNFCFVLVCGGETTVFSGEVCNFGPCLHLGFCISVERLWVVLTFLGKFFLKLPFCFPAFPFGLVSSFGVYSVVVPVSGSAPRVKRFVLCLYFFSGLGRHIDRSAYLVWFGLRDVAVGQELNIVHEAEPHFIKICTFLVPVKFGSILPHSSVVSLVVLELRCYLRWSFGVAHEVK